MLKAKTKQRKTLVSSFNKQNKKINLTLICKTTNQAPTKYGAPITKA
jgi:hypothetical protein